MKYFIACVSAALFAMAGSAEARSVTEPAAVAKVGHGCEGLANQVVDPNEIGVPSGPARVLKAAVASEESDGRSTPFCKVEGEILPIDPSASPILFQLNLPIKWNGKAVMPGGGGFNGIMRDGVGPSRDAPHGFPTPLARGYATFGTDSGHQIIGRDDPTPAKFALNDEMFQNFAFAAYKKVADVGRVVSRRHYGAPVRRLYYYGGSEGGREGLAMAQRFPADFDGVISVVPVISWTGLMSSYLPMSAPQYAGAVLDQPARELIARSVKAQCDRLDGLNDGVVSNYLGCKAQFRFDSLACRGDGTNNGDCLSPGQLEIVRSVYEPRPLIPGLANGVTIYPGRLPGGEILFGEADGLKAWVSNGNRLDGQLSAANPRGVLYGQNYVRFVITRDPNFDVTQFDPKQWANRIRSVSTMMDTTNPDLSTFWKRGGKLIIRENAADMAQSPMAGFEYFDQVTRKLGARKVNTFMRLYVSPGSGHGGRAESSMSLKPIATERDLLDDLDSWVERHVAPADKLMAVLSNPVHPFTTSATRPLCRYPSYPHYRGGDVASAMSYACQIGTH